MGKVYRDRKQSEKKFTRDMFSEIRQMIRVFFVQMDYFYMVFL